MAWTCSKCGRVFAKVNQSHSCKVFPLENHFKNKSFAKDLFDYLLVKLKPLKFSVDPVACCIHLVFGSTFAAVWALRSGIRIDFRLNFSVKSKRFSNVVKMSANRYLYFVDVKNKDEINHELLSWIKESYNLIG